MRIEAELFGSPVQFPKGFKACLIERWVSPPRRRLRPSNRDSPLFPGDVLPLQSLDLARAQSAKEVECRRDVGEEPGRFGRRHREQTRLFVICQSLPGRRLGVLERFIIFPEAVPQLRVLQQLSQDREFAIHGFGCPSEVSARVLIRG
jgi:hypothetical protein